MKKKIHKILGIGLAFMLVASLMVVFAPVALADPGDNKWSKYSTPSSGSGGDWFMDEDIDALGSLVQAIDGTLYAYADLNSVHSLMKSDDGGRTWTDMTRYAGGAIVDIAVSTEDADSFWVADATTVYRTVDAGEHYTALTSATDHGGVLSSIESLTAGYTSDEPYLFVAATDVTATSLEDVYVLGTAYGAIWSAMGIPGAGGDDIYDVVTSPNFNDEADPLLLAIVDEGAATTDVSVYYKYGGGAWNGTEGPADLYTQTATPNVPLASDIAFPEDFDADGASGEMEFFVVIDDGTASGDDDGGAYWLIIDNVVERKVGADYDFVSVDMVGEVGDGSLLAGTSGGSVWWSTNYGSTWTETKKAPSRDGDVFVLMAADFLETEEAWALADGTDRALSFTDDGGVLWNQISLIDTAIATIIDFEPTPDWGSSGALFMVTDDGGNSVSISDTYKEGDTLWKYDGTYWERVFHVGVLTSPEDSIDDVEVSPEWTDDEAVFFIDWDSPRIYRSTDGGDKFSRQLSAPTTAKGWLVVDQSTIVVGLVGGTSKSSNNGTTWGGDKDAGSDPIATFALDPNDPDNMLCANDQGAVYLSEDGAGKWKQKPSSTATTYTTGTDNYDFVAFDPEYADNSFIYAAARGEEVYRAEIGEDTSWKKISSIAGNWVDDIGGDPSVSVDSMWNIQVGPNGVLYVVNWDTTASATNPAKYPVARSINPATGGTTGDNAVYFETISSGWDETDVPYGLWLTTGSSNVLWTINWDDAKIWTLTDEIYEGPRLTSPSNKSSSMRVDEVSLRWSQPTNATDYYVFISEDEDFDTYMWFAVTAEAIRTTGISGWLLEDGRTYYWKVAVQEQKKALSLWSDAWSFTTALGEAQWNPFVGGVPESPSNGATGVALMPTFSWNAADWATGYEFVLADNAGFSSPIVSKTLDGTVYLSEQALALDTTYYWRVRAKSATSQSEWATGVFTTMSKAVPAPTPAPPVTVTPPAPIVLPTPIPPALLWTIIGIGALLIIAVIVLIIRTRRPV